MVDAKADTVGVHVEDARNLKDVNAVIAQDTGFAEFTRLEAVKHFWWPTMLCVMSYLGCMNDGYQSQLPGNLISNQGFINQFGTVVNSDGTLSLAASYVSLFSAMVPFGQIPGSFFASYLGDKFGRRAAMLGFTVMYISGTLIEMFAKTPGQWTAAKFLFGFGQGFTVAILPVYVNELSPPQIRGTLMCFYGFFYAIGQLFAAVVLYVVENNRPLDWRIAVYTEWAFHGLWIVFGFIWLPESPVYYVRKGQTEKAKKTLNRIYKGIKGFDQDRELRVLQMEVDRELEASTTSSLKDWLDLFKGTNRLRTLGAGLAISTQIWSGCNLVFSYTTYFIQEAGIGEAFTASLIVTCVLIAGLLTSFVAVEALGRRPLLLGGCICCTICNLVIGITGCFPQTPALNNAALAFIFLWVFSYGTAFAGVCWALTSEGASARLKTQTAAFATLVYDVASLVFTVAVPYMIGTSGPGARNWGTRSVFMYFISCAAATVGNYFLCPETKGRTQAEIDEMYENKIPPRKFAKYVSELQSAKAARAQL